MMRLQRQSSGILAETRPESSIEPGWISLFPYQDITVESKVVRRTDRPGSAGLNPRLFPMPRDQASLGLSFPLPTSALDILLLKYTHVPVRNPEAPYRSHFGACVGFCNAGINYSLPYARKQYINHLSL
jgi:hypothetical protein